MEGKYWSEITTMPRLTIASLAYIAYEPNDALCKTLPKAIPLMDRYWLVPAIAIYAAFLPIQLLWVLAALFVRLFNQKVSRMDTAAGIALVVGSIFAMDWIAQYSFGASFTGYLIGYYSSIFGL